MGCSWRRFVGGVLAPINSTMLAWRCPRSGMISASGMARWRAVSAYLIAMAWHSPRGAPGRPVGRGPVFRTGLALFLVLSLAIVASPTFPVLIALRTCQALIGSTVIPNGMAMLRETQQ